MRVRKEIPIRQGSNSSEFYFGTHFCKGSNKGLGLNSHVCRLRLSWEVQANHTPRDTDCSTSQENGNEKQLLFSFLLQNKLFGRGRVCAR